MKFIDKNGRLFGRISVIDLLVIAVVLVMAAALYVKNTRLDVSVEEPVDQPEQAITLQIRVNSVRNYVYRSLQVGDELRDRDYSSGDEPLGVITEIQVTRDPGTALSALNDGTVEMTPVEDTVDLLITVSCSGVVEGRTYSINGVYSVGINSTRNYCTRLSQFTGVVADVH